MVKRADRDCSTCCTLVAGIQIALQNSTELVGINLSERM